MRYFVHETAVVINCILGKNIYIGPYCFIRNCTIGDNCNFESFCDIGGEPEHRDHTPMGEGFIRKTQQLVIGERNYFRSFSVVQQGMKRMTVIGNDNMFFSKCHVSHDCVIGDENVFAAGVLLGGSTTVRSRVNFGSGSITHQGILVSSYSMIGQGAQVTREVPPNALIAAAPARHIGDNEWAKKRWGDVSK